MEKERENNNTKWRKTRTCCRLQWGVGYPSSLPRYANAGRRVFLSECGRAVPQCIDYFGLVEEVLVVVVGMAMAQAMARRLSATSSTGQTASFRNVLDIMWCAYCEEFSRMVPTTAAISSPAPLSLRAIIQLTLGMLLQLLPAIHSSGRKLVGVGPRPLYLYPYIHLAPAAAALKQDRRY